VPKTDPRVDRYIAQAQPFARPILSQLRGVVHRVCPEVGETIKWGMPFFEYQGLLCHMAAFQRHCAFSIWRGSQVVGDAASDEAMGQFGRIGSLAQLPSEQVLAGFLQAAMVRNEAGGAKAPPRKPKGPVVVPPELVAALDADPAVKAAFDALSPGHRREHARWVAEARREDTRQRRAAQVVERLRERVG